MVVLPHWLPSWTRPSRRRSRCPCSRSVSPSGSAPGGGRPLANAVPSQTTNGRTFSSPPAATIPCGCSMSLPMNSSTPPWGATRATAVRLRPSLGRSVLRDHCASRCPALPSRPVWRPSSAGWVLPPTWRSIPSCLSGRGLSKVLVSARTPARAAARSCVRPPRQPRGALRPLQHLLRGAGRLPAGTGVLRSRTGGDVGTAVHGGGGP